MDKMHWDCAVVLAGSVAGDIRGSEIGGSSRNVMSEFGLMHRPVSHVEVEQKASMVIECDKDLVPRPLGDALDSSGMGSNRGADIQRGKSRSHVSCSDHAADVGKKPEHEEIEWIVCKVHPSMKCASSPLLKERSPTLQRWGASSSPSSVAQNSSDHKRP
jgi:hypothetical protein